MSDDRDFDYDDYFELEAARDAELAERLEQLIRQIITAAGALYGGDWEAIDYLADLFTSMRTKRLKRQSPASKMLDMMLLAAYQGAEKGQKRNAAVALGKKRGMTPAAAIRRVRRQQAKQDK